MLKIREQRKRRNLTIKELADSAGLSISYISQVERGEVDPSLSSLRKIAAVFQVPIYILIDHRETYEGLTVRKNQRISKYAEHNSIVYTFLSPLPSGDFLPKSILMEFQIKPFSQDVELPIVHHSEEVITVYEGILTVSVGDTEVVLEPGDTTVIREDVPHICKNTTDKPVRGIAAISPPVWGSMNI